MTNDLMLRVLQGKPVERIPVWMMRQAGRILPEYRKIRESVSGFKELVETPHLAAEVTIQPVDSLEVDAAIIFSDILVVPEAMGLPYEMVEKRGPYFPKTIQHAGDVAALKVAHAATDLHYVGEAIKIVKKELNGRVPIIGFAGAPWTIFCYMIEGKGSKTFSEAKKMLYTQPELSIQLLDKITETTMDYVQYQLDCGADWIQLFDSWAGVLSQEQYLKFSLPFMEKISKHVNKPVTFFAKDAHFLPQHLIESSCTAVSIDWTMDIRKTRNEVGSKVLQGNLDPCSLYGSFKDIERETHNMIAQFGKDAYIANLGHGLYPDIDRDHVKCFVDAVKSYVF